MQSSYFNENWKKLQNHLEQDQIPHLRELLKDADRSDQMFVEYDGITLDFSHQKMTSKTLALLIGIFQQFYEFLIS